MAARKSIYISKPNDQALQSRFGQDEAMQDNGQLNYSRAVNAALDEWQQGQGRVPAVCPICDNTGCPSAASDAGFYNYCSCRVGKQNELNDLRAHTGKITQRIEQLKQEIK